MRKALFSVELFWSDLYGEKCYTNTLNGIELIMYESVLHKAAVSSIVYYGRQMQQFRLNITIITKYLTSCSVLTSEAV